MNMLEVAKGISRRIVLSMIDCPNLRHISPQLNLPSLISPSEFLFLIHLNLPVYEYKN